MIKFIVLYWAIPSLDFKYPDGIFGDFDSIEEADAFGDEALPDEGEFMVLPKTSGHWITHEGAVGFVSLVKSEKIQDLTLTMEEVKA